jgi:hypothetical protein
MTYEAYMQKNSANPAIRGHGRPPQEAFKDYSKPAVISGSSLDAPPAPEKTEAPLNPAVPPPTTPPVSGSTIAPGGGTTTNDGPQVH